MGGNKMELDELKAKWAEHDRKLDTLVRLNRQMLSASQLGRVRSSLQRLLFGLALEAILTFALICVLNAFLYRNIGQVRFVLPAGALDAAAILLLHILVRQIILASQMDYSKPIAVLQQEIERL